MAYEWFNSAPAFDPMAMKSTNVGAVAITTPFDTGAGTPIGGGVYTTPNTPSPLPPGPVSTITPTVPIVTTPTDIGTSTPTGTGTYTTSVTQNPYGTDPAAGLYGTGGGGGTPPAATTNLFQDQIYILILKLKSVGIPASTAERAGAFFQNILNDGITDLDNAVDIFLYAKSYKAKNGTDIPSPYYQDFGKFNDKLTSAKPPGVMVPWVLGLKDVFTKYEPGALYSTDDAIQKYLQNDVKVSDLDTRLNTARLKAVTADSAYTDALIKLGYISKPSDLTGFFASPELGQKQLEQNASTGAFAAEAIRRAKVGGIQADLEFAKQETADLLSQGYNEAQIAAIAEKNYSTIASNIGTVTKLSGIYQGKNAATAQIIQSELQQQEFNSIDSERARTLANQEIGAFSGSAGLSGASSYSRKASLNTPTGGEL